MKVIYTISCSFTALALLLGVAWLAGLRVNVTPSLPYGLYQMTAEAPTRDSLVTLCLNGEDAEFALERGYLQAGSCPSGTQPLLKRLAALPGDDITVEEEGIFINGALFPQSKISHRDSHARPVSSRLSPGRIPEGFALVLSGDHSGSFDGRYFGLVPLSQLQTVKEVVRACAF